jgi:hypothetical protein
MYMQDISLRCSYMSHNRAFFNYITGVGGQSPPPPPQPPWCPPNQPFWPQSPFSLKYKQNMEFRREVWYSSNWNFLCESYVLSFIFNAKRCVVNTLLDFKLNGGLHIQDLINLSCWKDRLNKLMTAGGVGSRGQRGPNPLFYS